VRREVAKMFPSPGPGRYTNGIALDKLGERLLQVLEYDCRFVSSALPKFHLVFCAVAAVIRCILTILIVRASRVSVSWFAT
jgi:hypothetical protein